ncbi:hypothetical protein R69608_07616 [Paraburkholderia nemoris]|uniref:Uncharacterized protein n=1 Tax=Paraburkholderia nemoris TaxID=2793076 RepID=A0ABM8SGB2_9BURK|nr:hypothetical protein R75777_05383 [Paraburkholderia nemoris]CAE6807474.1 hypothetical protein R69776_05524 [Paraburkholderia nemoris]CAE6971585.1 hypothetical protein R69608_07616 [Paraburkholderia nemoris]
MGEVPQRPAALSPGATRRGTGSAIRNGLSGARVCGEADWLAPHGRKAAPGKKSVGEHHVARARRVESAPLAS